MHQGPAESGTAPVGGVQAFAKQTLPQGEFISPEDVKRLGSQRGCRRVGSMTLLMTAAAERPSCKPLV